jgi:beta-phosphoglucomutase-like phosphatase (HAD superfamily)
MGVRAADCIAIEDSESGALAANRAGIPLIGYVGAYSTDKMDTMARVLKDKCGATKVMYDWAQFPSCLEAMSSVLS